MLANNCIPGGIARVRLIPRSVGCELNGSADETRLREAKSQAIAEYAACEAARRKANRCERKARVFKLTALQHARRAGEHFTIVKEALGHGQWIKWLEASKIPEHQPRNYMRVAEIYRLHPEAEFDLALQSIRALRRRYPKSTNQTQDDSASDLNNQRDNKSEGPNDRRNNSRTRPESDVLAEQTGAAVDDLIAFADRFREGLTLDQFFERLDGSELHDRKERIVLFLKEFARRLELC